MNASHIHEFQAERALANLFRQKVGDALRVTRGSEIGDETSLPMCNVLVRSAEDAVPGTGTMDVELVVSVMTALDMPLDDHITLCGRVFDVLYGSNFLSDLTSAGENIRFQRAILGTRYFQIAPDMGLRTSYQAVTLRTAMVET